MYTGQLTPKSNSTVNRMLFSGSFDQPDGFGSVLNVSVNEHGHATLTLCYKNIRSSEEHIWSIILDNEQRRALSKMLVSYEPTLIYEVPEGER